MEKNKFKTNKIASIWKLKPIYTSYRIFLWLENRADVLLFTRMAFSGVSINGFCNNQADSMSTFLGKPIVAPADIIQETDILLIYGEEYKKAELENQYPQRNLIYLFYEELFEVREEMLEKKVIILYDSVMEAKKVAGQLQKFKIAVEGTCVIGNKAGNDLPGKKFSQDKLLENIDKYNIVLASGKLYCEKSILRMPDRNINFFVPSKDIFYTATTIILLGCMGLYLDKAIKKNKKIILYGLESWYTDSWLQFFYNMNIDLYKIVNDSEDIEADIDSVYDLAYENTNDVFIIINKKISNWVKACELIASLGFSEFNEMYTGLYAVCYHHFPEIPDVTLGYVTSALISNSNCKGFHIYGEEQKEKYRIVTLGGSTTTSEAFRVPCWPEILYERLKQEDKDVIIYNGGVDGYTAANELYKLIRDVGCLTPDLVISFSGVNNRFFNPHPYISSHLITIFDEILPNSYCKGLENIAMSAVETWVQQEQMMHSIVEEVYHAKFICFIQPMYISKKVLQPWERLQFETSKRGREVTLSFREEVSKIAKQFEWMIDLQDFLDDFPAVFLDNMHVYEEGNRMIVNKIYDYIKKEI